jgi:hypothetical protein
LSAIQKLPKVQEESFFARYARGDQSAIQHTDTPPALEAAPLPAAERGPGGELNGSRLQQGPSPGTGTVIGDSPPDLTQSVENVYRSFLSDGYRTTRSDSLTTPNSDLSGFDFGTGNRGEYERRISPRQSPESYAAYHASRYAKLGYFEAPLASNEDQRRKAVRMCVFMLWHCVLLTDQQVQTISIST